MVCGCSGRYRFRTSRTRVPSLCERARHHASSATHRLSVSRRQFFSSRQSRRAQVASQVRVHASVADLAGLRIGLCVHGAGRDVRNAARACISKIHAV